MCFFLNSCQAMIYKYCKIARLKKNRALKYHLFKNFL